MIHNCEDKRLIAGSKEYFEANPDLKEVFVSGDGQYFLTVSKANFHCKNKTVRLYRVKKTQLDTSKKPISEKPKEAKTAPEKTEPVKTETVKPEEVKESTGKPTTEKKGSAKTNKKT